MTQPITDPQILRAMADAYDTKADRLWDLNQIEASEAAFDAALDLRQRANQFEDSRRGA